MKLKYSIITLFIYLNLISNFNSALSKTSLEEKLLNAIRTNNVKKVKKILNNSNLDINAQLPSGKTPFYEALINFAQYTNTITNQITSKILSGSSIITSGLYIFLAGQAVYGYSEMKLFEMDKLSYANKKLQDAKERLSYLENKKINVSQKITRYEINKYTNLLEAIKKYDIYKINEYRKHERKILTTSIIGSIIFIISTIGLMYASKRLKSNYDKSKEIIDLIRNMPSCIPDEESIQFGEQKFLI